jgi:hypothetical protein
VISLLVVAAAIAGAPVSASDIKALDVSGDVLVNVRVDKQADTRVPDGIEATLDGDSLKLVAPPRADVERPTVDLVVTSLRAVSTHGTSQVRVRDLAGRALEVNLQGASLVVLAGKASTLTVTGRGTARLDARALAASTADITLADASRGEVRASFALTCDLSRAARLVVEGKPARVKKKVTGVAKLDLR